MLHLLIGIAFVALLGYGMGAGGVLLGLFLWMLFAACRAYGRWMGPKPAEDRVRKVIRAEVEKNLDTLARKRMQLVRKDDYGTVDAKPWNDEIERFLQSRIYPNLAPGDLTLVQPRLSALATELIETPAHKRHVELAKELAYDEGMTPTMFEHYCATVLQRGGWSCEVTKASGDQGVDVVATKGQVRLALQCKKYGGPVGNAAVQEIAAARIHVGATFAAVVSTAGYTKSARELAATTKTLLLHHSELLKIDEILAD